nr:protein kinase-like domain, phloem protein 2-like protein [Tanacetum cinerariifolium]
MIHLCFPTKGIRLIWPNSYVTLAIRVLLDRPIGLEECATWDGGNNTWGGRARVFGTVPVCVSVQEMAGGEGRVLAGRVVNGTVGCRPIGLKDAATWVWGHNTWGGRGKDFYQAFVEQIRKDSKYISQLNSLPPLIDYTGNLVFCEGNSSKKQKYVGLTYKLEGETETSIVYVATETEDNRSFIAELYRFTIIDLKIVFFDHKDDLAVEGILLQPLEKVS